MFHSGSSWIWSSDVQGRFNNFVCFRRTFEVADPRICTAEGGCATLPAALLLTADARYELYLNGRWIGHGPPRSWLSPWPVDTYDLSGLLKPGRNVLAVLVQQIGTDTFQYLNAEPGLLAQLEWTDAAGEHRLVTDASWKATPHRAFAGNVPRISCQQAWEEQFDARVAPGLDWAGEEFDDATWPAARDVRKPGEGAHREFELRDIPFLTRQVTEPARVISFEAVRPAPYCFSLKFEPIINPDDHTANYLHARLLHVTFIHSASDQPIEIHQPHYDCPIKLNGRELAPDDHSLQLTDAGVAHGRLKKGVNLLLCRTHVSHLSRSLLAIRTKKPVRFSARPDGESVAGGTPAARAGKMPATLEPPFLVLGPFGSVDEKIPPSWVGPEPVRPESFHPDATADRYETIWQRGTLDEADLSADFTRPFPAELSCPVDVFLATSSDRPVKGAAVTVDNPADLQRDTPEWTVIHPGAGGDVRVLLDFGDELVGYHEFELDAPAGTVIDNQNFEFIQPDGRFNLAEGMNNSFRYVCREGLQRWRTFVRRGFRYSWLTFRNFARPVRVRMVRAILSAYPVTGAGAFACSDELLDRIWQIGARSVRCCSEDTYTDCPTYEQTHWVGDARNESLVDLVTNGDPRLSRHCWLQVGRSLSRSTIVESEVPSGWYNVLPAWTFLWMRWGQEHYHLTGDTEFGRTALDMLERNNDGIARHVNADGLFEIVGWNMFDWAPMDTASEGVMTHLNCLAVLGLRQSAELARAMRQPARAKTWDALADKLAKATNKHLWDDRRKAYIDCIHADGTRSKVFSQQTHTTAYISGVAAGGRADRCWQIMRKAPKGFVTAGSPFFMFFMLEALARQGDWPAMIDTIRSYWGIQAQAGATTFWEMYWPDAPRLTRSHCHGWSAAPTFFLSHHVLGIQPATPGYATVRVAPQPGGLDWARGRVPTPRGVVECSWSRTGKQFTLRLVLPPKTPATLELPATGKLSVQEGKVKKLASARGVTKLSTPGGTVRLTVG